MYHLKYLTLLSIAGIFFVACGSGGKSVKEDESSVQKYCVLNANPAHFSPNGSCFQIQSIALNNPSTNFTTHEDTISAKVNEDIYFSYTYDDSDFVGDVALFSSIVSFVSKDLNQSDVRILEPLALGGGWIITASRVGSMVVTLEVKDEAFILDKKVFHVTITN